MTPVLALSDAAPGTHKQLHNFTNTQIFLESCVDARLTLLCGGDFPSVWVDSKECYTITVGDLALNAVAELCVRRVWIISIRGKHMYKWNSYSNPGNQEYIIRVIDKFKSLKAQLGVGPWACFQEMQHLSWYGLPAGECSLIDPLYWL